MIYVFNHNTPATGLLKIKALAVLLLLAVSHLSAQELLSEGKWSQETVSDGITLRSGAFRGLFDSNQYLSVLEVTPEARFDIVSSEELTLETTSTIANRAGAVAAINGSFFNMSAPYGSVNYFRVDGQELAPNDFETCESCPKSRSILQTGALATFEGRLSVLKSDSLARWERDIEAEDMVTSGPMLIVGGACEEVISNDFNSNRHPRTAVGIRPDGTVLLVVADGRNEAAAGLSMIELQQVMLALGCAEAINLDGGGSTTMVVRGQVVNHPCDNHQFDADGERPVANAICVSLR